MKKGNIFPDFPLDSNIDNIKNDDLINIEKRPNYIKAKNNHNSFNDSINASENWNKEEMDQSELNNFNIEFFLPKELQEELNINKNVNEEQENNTLEINNPKELDFNEFNFVMYEEKDINKEKDKMMDKNINNISMNKENVNSKEDNNQCLYNTKFLLDKIKPENKEDFPSNDKQNDIRELINNKNTEINNKLSIYLNDVFEINNNYNLNNNLNINEQNFFPKNFNFSNANSIEFLNQNYKQNIFPFNNNNSFYPPLNNYNIINENNFTNNQAFYNDNNYINPINQINLNFNQINSFNNNMKNFNFNTGQQKKKIIDEYTLEMFGRVGWICEQCNNFNYETRNKCNRCHMNKMPKRIIKDQNSLEGKNNPSKSDWICSNCRNFNYSFRIICNRCKKKKFD